MSEDVDDIAGLIVRYATAIDTRDWDLFRSCFVEDAACDYGDIGKFADLNALTEFMRTIHASLGATNHMLSNFVIEVDGDRARARSYVHAVLVAEEDPGTWWDSVGVYDDRFTRTPMGWKIARRSFQLTRMSDSASD